MLEVQILFSERSISHLNLIVFVTARDIHGFLSAQIHENAIEINCFEPETGIQRRKVPDRLWIIILTYLTGRTDKL